MRAKGARISDVAAHLKRSKRNIYRSFASKNKMQREKRLGRSRSTNKRNGRLYILLLFFKFWSDLKEKRINFRLK